MRLRALLGRLRWAALGPLAGLRHVLAAIHPPVAVTIGATAILMGARLVLAMLGALMLTMLHSLMLGMVGAGLLRPMLGVGIAGGTGGRALRQCRGGERKRDRGSNDLHDFAP